MKAIDDDTINRVERNEQMRALAAHERKAAELRSALGLLQREKYESVAPISLPADGITRMRTDQIDRLYDSGKINVDQRAAALKIRTVWEAMSRGLYPGPTGGIVGTKSRGRFRHPLERMSNRDFFIWIKEYKPWANGPASKTAIRCGRGDHFQRSYLQVCYAVVVDNYGPHQLEQEWPVNRGKGVITRALQAGLGAWRHVEYDGNADLEDLREEIIATSVAKVESARPARMRNIS